MMNPSSSGAILEGVRASAGSGKTYDLTVRYIRRLAAEGDPGQMLATTFTRKAAGEILDRLLKRLADAATCEHERKKLSCEIGAELAEEDALRMLGLVCREMHRLSISTIDSFFHRLARTQRLRIGLPLESALFDNNHPRMAALRLEAVCELIAADASLGPVLDALAPRRAPRKIAEALDELIGQLYEATRQTTPECWRGPAVPEAPGEAETEAALCDVRCIAENHQAAAVRRAAHADAARFLAREWAKFAVTGIAGALAAQKVSFNRVPLTQDISEPYAPLLRYAANRVLGDLAAKTRAYGEAMQRFREIFDGLRERERALLFSDIPQALAGVMSAGGVDADHRIEEIAYRLDDSVDHLLLDEFQDTNPEQWSILKALAQRIAAKSPPLSLFCVGDVKQAIYGWRGACPEIFDRMGQDIKGLVWSHKEISYRSSPVVLDCVNAVFGTIAENGALQDHPETAQDWQRQFHPHEAFHKDRPGYAELVTSPAAEDADEAEEETEEGSLVPAHFRFVAERVAELRKAAPGCSIGVLTRSNKAAEQLRFALNTLGVRVGGAGGSSVADDPAVEAVLAALTLADHPGDSAAAFHVAHSPLAAGLGLAQPVSGAPVPHGDACAAAGRIRRALLERGYGAVVAGWAEALAPWCGDRGRRRLAQLVALAEQHDGAASLRASEFVQIALSVPVSEPDAGEVRVMTIHAAKGLEFDIVVLPEMHNRKPSKPDAVIVSRPDPAGPIQAVYAYPDKIVRALAGLHGVNEIQTSYDQSVARQVHGDLCTLYVAMTRAKYALHIIVPPRKATQEGLWSDSGTARAILRMALDRDSKETAAGNEILYMHGDRDWMSDVPMGEPAPSPERADTAPSVRLKPAPAALVKSITPSSLEGSAHINVADVLAPRQSAAQRFGVAIHALFEQVEWIEAGLPAEAELTEVCRAAVPSADAAWCCSAVQTFVAMLACEEVQAALTRPAPHPGEHIELWRERPFVSLHGRDVMSGTFDRVVVYRSSGDPVRAHVLDFKSDDVPVGAIPDRARYYAPQLGAYRQALCTMLGLQPEDVTAEILFVRPGVRSVVE